MPPRLIWKRCQIFFTGEIRRRLWHCVTLNVKNLSIPGQMAKCAQPSNWWALLFAQKLTYGHSAAYPDGLTSLRLGGPCRTQGWNTSRGLGVPLSLTWTLIAFFMFKKAMDWRKPWPKNRSMRADKNFFVASPPPLYRYRTFFTRQGHSGFQELSDSAWIT